MSTTIEYRPSNEEVIQDLIAKLLDKTEDREMNIQLFGFPANCLDSPLPKKRVMEQTACSVQNTEYVDVEIMTVTDGDVVTSMIFDLSIPEILLDFGIGKKYIKTQKLRSILDAYAGRSYVRTSGNQERFIIKLPTRLLLDNSGAM